MANHADQNNLSPNIFWVTETTEIMPENYFFYATGIYAAFYTKSSKGAISFFFGSKAQIYEI